MITLTLFKVTTDATGGYGVAWLNDAGHGPYVAGALHAPTVAEALAAYGNTYGEYFEHDLDAQYTIDAQSTDPEDHFGRPATKRAR